MRASRLTSNIIEINIEIAHGGYELFLEVRVSIVECLLYPDILL